MSSPFASGKAPAGPSSGPTEGPYRPTPPMNAIEVEPARAEDLQKSYATVVSNQGPEGFYGSMSG